MIKSMAPNDVDWDSDIRSSTRLVMLRLLEERM